MADERICLREIVDEYGSGVLQRSPCLGQGEPGGEDVQGRCFSGHTSSHTFCPVTTAPAPPNAPLNIRCRRPLWSAESLTKLIEGVIELVFKTWVESRKVRKIARQILQL